MERFYDSLWGTSKIVNARWLPLTLHYPTLHANSTLSKSKSKISDCDNSEQWHATSKPLHSVTE